MAIECDCSEFVLFGQMQEKFFITKSSRRKIEKRCSVNWGILNDLDNMVYLMKTKHRAKLVVSESISVTIIEYRTWQFLHKSIKIALLEAGEVRDMVAAAVKGLPSTLYHA